MAKTNQRGRSSGSSQFVMLHHWMLNSPAYRSLTPVERALLVDVMKLYNSVNNGFIGLSIRKAAKNLNISPNTAEKGLVGLQDKGFIRVAQLGSFHQKVRHATMWILTMQEYNGQPPTRDFMSLQQSDIDRMDAEKNKTRYQRLRRAVSKSETEGKNAGACEP